MSFFPFIFLFFFTTSSKKGSFRLRFFVNFAEQKSKTMNRKDGTPRSSVDWWPHKHVETVQRPREQRTNEIIYEVLSVINLYKYSRSYFRTVNLMYSTECNLFHKYLHNKFYNLTSVNRICLMCFRKPTFE